jgi:branched-chain amino acid transport system permease protein
MTLNTRNIGRVASFLGEPRIYLGISLILLASQLPYVIAPSYIHLLILTFIIGTAAVAWNIIGGFGGQFSLGNAVFFGIMAYTMGILMVTYQQSFLVSFAVAMLFVIIAAVIIGYPSFKLTGHYFALATIAVVEGVRFLTRYLQEITGGAQGFSLIPATTRGVTVLNLTRPAYFQLALILFVVAVFVSVWTRYSKLGYYLMALRDDQLAAASLGINVSRYKMYGWLLCAVLTGFAGAMYAVYIQFLEPRYLFSIPLSVKFAVIPIIGGIGTIVGPIIGTLLIVPLEHFAVTEFGGRYGAVTYVVYGIVLILFIIYAPEGLVPKLKFVGSWIEERLPSMISDEDADEADNAPWRH